MADDIVERLRLGTDDWMHGKDVDVIGLTVEAADVIETQQAEIEKLRSAGERLAIHLDAHYGLENPHPNDIFLALNEWQKVYPRD